ncbi:MAG TPA: hypothetical protein ENJ43_04595 [Gammaproteobacteria bacterium]|nr:hypothetical protein [Gammaproteobacteria bacterium]
MHTIRRLAVGPLPVIFLALVGGCDGSDLPLFGPGEKEVYSGQFLDSAVANLDYKTATSEGTTDASGRFSYRSGESISFSIGGVLLGETDAQEIITPVNLVDDGTTATPAVRNITRFLQALDQDGDPANGITISDAVRAAAGEWDGLDFSADDFDDRAAPILTSAGSADGRTITMQSAADAARHLEQTIFCAYSGGFTGTFSGGSGQGSWMLTVDDEGNISGVGRDANANTFRLDGMLNPDSRSSFWADYYSVDASQPEVRWEGAIHSSGMVTGSWESGSPPQITTLTGNRKLLALTPGTGDEIYQGTLELSSGTHNDKFETADVGIIRLAVGDGVVSGKGYIYLENSDFTIPETDIIDDNFGFQAAGKQFLGRIEGDSIILGLTDLATGKIGGGSACKAP